MPYLAEIRYEAKRSLLAEHDVEEKCPKRATVLKHFHDEVGDRGNRADRTCTVNRALLLRLRLVVF